jgi:hypothetical protein
VVVVGLVPADAGLVLADNDDRIGGEQETDTGRSLLGECEDGFLIGVVPRMETWKGVSFCPSQGFAGMKYLGH